MNSSEMVVAIIIVITVGSVLKARYGVHRHQTGPRPRPGFAFDASAETEAENARLRDEVRALKERVQVLERVVTDNEGSLRLDREIERLRDKNSL